MTSNLPHQPHQLQQPQQPHQTYLLPEPDPSKRNTRHTVTVTVLERLAGDVYRLQFTDEAIAQAAKPGQFVNLYSANPLHMLPRPFGVCEVQENNVEIVFAVVGEGTHLDVLGPLGKPFDLSADAHYLLVGGGLGVPPLISCAQWLHQHANPATHTTTALFGYRDEHFAEPLISQYVDHSYAISNAQGNVINLLNTVVPTLAMDGLPTVLLSCGPLPMMRAVATWAATWADPSFTMRSSQQPAERRARKPISTQFSIEARMACGYGTCVGCAIDTVDGRKKACFDGPVFSGAMLGWERTT